MLQEQMQQFTQYYQNLMQLLTFEQYYTLITILIRGILY